MQRRVHPSVPTAAQLAPTPLGASTRANLVPPRPNYAGLRRPSEIWLKNPGWIDGASEPPIYFHSQDEILMTMLTFNPEHPMFHSPQAPGGPGTENTPPASLSAPPAGSVDVSPPANATVLTDSVPDGGYQVSVIASYSAPDTSKITSYRSKPVLKTVKQSKLGFIDIDNLDRCTFISNILAVHDYANDYSPGVHRGPPFKISWTGSSGGKSGAPIIDTDAEFEVVRASLRKKNAPAVVVEYNLDDMDGYRVTKKRVSFRFSAVPQEGDEDPELVHGTKVPRVEDFSAKEQLHGEMILKLKTKWPCEKHAGENGDLGHCWIDVGGNHVGLNMRKLKIWASAIVAGEATVREPPNGVEFDGLRDGRLTRARGRAGPRVSHSSGDSSDTVAIVTALMPLLQGLAPQNKTPPRTVLPRAFPTTPRKPTSPISPIPTESSELHSCLEAFLKAKNINLLDAESALAAVGLTPDVIGDVPVNRLREITGAVEGHLWGLHAFAREWSARLAEKKRRLAAPST
ncbi:hypothetical protein C8R45DRAFT_835651 [Mycena sanguinolenta]|nr:hypothetical protein C8R45DRAFT_835651 [Mycena sanguinolenta]